MQLCNVIVRLKGSLHNTVHKQNVTPAEILILRHIHGDDAVVNIRPTRFDKTILQTDERDRLAKFYDRRADGFTSAPGENSKSIIATLFPGAMAKLPTTLAEIGLGEFEPPAAPAPRGRKPKAEKVDTVEPVAETADEAEGEPVDESGKGLSWATGPDEGDGEAEDAAAEAEAEGGA